MCWLGSGARGPSVWTEGRGRNMPGSGVGG